MLCCSSLAAAQEGRGSIEGQVVKDGKGVQNVLVLINELKLTELTDENGLFVFEAVPAGTYNLILTYGDETENRAVIVNAGQLTQPVFEVEWEIALTEEVTVTAVARAAKIVDAPSAVTSIPKEQIQEQASHGQVPKILEFTPGAEVTQSGLYDFNFNTRGFNSSLNRRVSTYIDGRDVGVVLLGAQEWAAIAGGLDDVAQLDFVRGPSAALYGANASSGVVNITTKNPRDSLGTLVRLTAGQLDTTSLDFRRADELGRGWYSKFLLGFKNSGDFTVSRNPDGPDNVPGTPDDLEAPEYSRFCEGVGRTDCLLEEKPLYIEQDNEIRYGSVRFDKYLNEKSVVTVEGGLSDISGPVFQTGIGRVQNLGSQRPFFRFAFSNGNWNALAHYSSRDGDQANLTKDLAVIDSALVTDTQRYGVEAQRKWDFTEKKIRFVIGGAYTEERLDTLDRRTGRQTVLYEPRDEHREALFTQFDWQATQRFKFVFAGRVDASTLHETQYSPKLAFVYSFTPKQSVRLTYNQAFQVANYSEFFLHARIGAIQIEGFAGEICRTVLPWVEDPPVDCGLEQDEDGKFLPLPVLAVGNEDLDLETTKAWEIGYSGLIANKVFMTVDYYRAQNEGFITDLIGQVGTVLGNLDGCLDEFGDPQTDPRECPINDAYKEWVSTEEAETELFLLNSPTGPQTYADVVRNAVSNVLGGYGLAMSQDLDGSTVIIGRTYANVGEVDTQGIDFGIQYFVTPRVNMQASYSWFDFEIVKSEFVDPPECKLNPQHPSRPTSACLEDILLPNTPAHKASLSVSYADKRWFGSLSGRWTQGFRWSAGVFTGDVSCDGLCDAPREENQRDYTTVDLAASYGITDHIRVGLNVANLLDSTHHQTFGGDLLTRRALLNMSFHW
jgi:outer membrane receptor protein involved in Fe transport